ncbi:hypothetical protein KAR48_11280 [bacterium]|nr:hypothetical protein [bacterium]
MKRLFNSILVIITFLSSTNIYSQARYGAGPLHIKIIENGQFREVSLSRKEIQEIPSDSVKAPNLPGTEDVTWVGAPLTSILKRAGVEISNLSKLVASSPDGYVSVFTGSGLKAIETGLCAYRISEMATFPENLGGLRLVYPNERGMYWVNSPSKIVVHIGSIDNKKRSLTIRSLKSSSLNKLTIPGNNGKHIFIAELFKNLKLPAGSFHILTRDSLFREYDNGPLFEKIQLCQWEDETWSIGGEDVPEGLKTLDIFYIQIENHGILLKSLNEKEAILWENKIIRSLIEPGINKEECGLTIFKQDGYSHPSLKQRFWIKDKWSFARLIEEEYKNIGHLDFLELTW